MVEQKKCHVACTRTASLHLSVEAACLPKEAYQAVIPRRQVLWEVGDREQLCRKSAPWEAGRFSRWQEGTTQSRTGRSSAPKRRQLGRQ